MFLALACSNICIFLIVNKLLDYHTRKPFNRVSFGLSNESSTTNKYGNIREKKHTTNYCEPLFSNMHGKLAIDEVENNWSDIEARNEVWLISYDIIS